MTWLDFFIMCILFMAPVFGLLSAANRFLKDRMTEAQFTWRLIAWCLYIILIFTEAVR